MKIICGCDLIDLRRVDAPWLNPVLLDKIFHPDELAKSTTIQRAGTFALKEAAIKAFGLTADDWLNVRVVRLPSGKPKVSVDISLEPSSLDCSISHDGDYLTAIIVGLIEQ